MRASALPVLAMLGCGGGGASLPAAPPDPTDVRPVLSKCLTCHGPSGPGVLLDASTTHALAGLIYERVHSGSMPPWMPGQDSPPFRGDYGLSAAERAQLEGWALAGAYLPPGPLPASTPDVPTRPPDGLLMMAEPYVPPPPPAGDEYRCFVLPVSEAATIVAYQWQLGHPGSSHHVTGLVLSAAGTARALARQRQDGRAGFACAALPADLDIVADLGASGVGPSGGQTLPSGVGAAIPVGGSVLMQLHYTGAAADGDRSAMRIWTTADSVRPLRQFALWAPVELPCPTGVSPDPTNRCSREYTLQRSTLQRPDEVRAQEGYVLSACGQTLSAKLQLPYSSTLSPHFMVPASCDGELPMDGTIYTVHGHMHTIGATLRVELEEDGTWRPLLDIARWRWWWERAYTFERPVRVKAHQRVRVSCTHDNGFAVQWSAVTHRPSPDAPSGPAPLEEPGYVVMGFEQRNEMCEVFLGWTHD